MIRMVADAELLADDGRDAFSRPDFADEAEGFGTTSEQTWKLCELLSAQPGCRTGWRLAVEGFHASFACPPEPPADCALTDAQGFSDGRACPALLME
jgi:hypothetical protein